jgi:hypothetical protein
MLRFNLALLAAALTAVTAGCTQCDTCDDFPTPCAGGSCGVPAYPPDAAGTYTVIAPGADAPMVLPPGVPLPPNVSTTPPVTSPPATTGATARPPLDITPPPPSTVGPRPLP